MSAHALRPTVQVDSPTEQRNPRTMDIDQLPTLEMLRLINAEDQLVPGAVAVALPELASAVDMAVDALRGGGRVHYVGAGTSGRLATVDTAELPPTFNVPCDWFIAHPAGGSRALSKAVENAEDDWGAGVGVIERNAAAGDFVLGLTASGRTPYVIGALEGARRIGARTGFVSCNPASSSTVDADTVIVIDTGPEAIAGSTRMKAGTAQKVVLTSFSTAVMVRLGRTYSNLMVSVMATNAKLRGRTLTILREATGCDEQECADAVAATGGDLKAAMVCLLCDVDPERAAAALAGAGGHVRRALASLNCC